MNERLVSPPDAPVLVVKTQGTDQTLRGGSQYRVGRDPQSDIVVSDSRVSWKHAVLRADGNCWLLEDNGSTNGTFLGTRRVGRVEITQNCVLRLGHPDDGPVMMLAVTRPTSVPASPGQSSVDRRPTTVMRAPTRRLRIGRAPSNDLVVPDLSVSRVHAELRNLGDGRYEIADLGSHNGTFVNGQRIDRPTTVSEQDLIGIGRATFRLFGDELREFIDEGDVSFVAQDLTVRLSGGKVLLDHVSFPIPERSLVGVIGPSGAGKSTLLGALTGMRPATEGTVLYDNRDLYTHYAELRHRIGLVPQDNILHAQLKPKRALRYAAELRFPGDTSRTERDRRVDEVIDELALTAHCGTRTGAMSGGQQKRVNVALELLTKPSLLFLDEPTSGLDPGLDKSVMEMLAQLAKDGRTVMVVTHSVANLASCDRLLVLVPGGKIAYFGTPADGLRHFGHGDWAGVFQDFEAQPDRDWAADYRRSAFCARYTSGPLQALGAAEAQAAEARADAIAARAVAAPPSRPAPPPRPASRLAQLSTLVRRYVSVIASDRNYVGVIALLPVILGVLIRAIPDAGGLVGPSNGLAIQLLLILVMSACLIGVANAVRELVKERTIYTRERAAGLSPAAYLASKLVVLGVISAVQAVVLVAIGLAGRPMPARGVLTSFPLGEIMLGVAVLAIASMTAGLLISAAVNSSDKTLPLLVVTVLVEVVLSGGVIRLNGSAGLQQLAWLTPSRWGFAAVASTIDLNHVTPPPPGSTPDPLWNHSVHAWVTSMVLQLVLSAVFALVTWTLLRRPVRR